MAKFDGIDFLEGKVPTKMGGGKVSSLDEEVGEQGQTRKDMIPSGNQEGIDEVEKNDIWSFGLLTTTLYRSLSLCSSSSFFSKDGHSVKFLRCSRSKLEVSVLRSKGLF